MLITVSEISTQSHQEPHIEIYVYVYITYSCKYFYLGKAITSIFIDKLRQTQYREEYRL